MPTLELCDKNGDLIKEGDLILSHATWLREDGKLRKGFPEKLRVIVRIWWDKYNACYYTELVCTHPDDMKFAEWGWYRECNWMNVRVSWDNKIKAYRQDMRSMHFEVIKDKMLIEFANNGNFDRLRGTQIK